MFNIEYIIKRLNNEYSPEVVNMTIQSLVNKGILEQYTDENGDFQFQLTKLGMDCAEDIIENPDSFLDSEEPEEENEVDI